MKALKRENKELGRANEILNLARVDSPYSADKAILQLQRSFKLFQKSDRICTI
jgi:hypothetical protein